MGLNTRFDLTKLLGARLEALLDALLEALPESLLESLLDALLEALPESLLEELLEALPVSPLDELPVSLPEELAESLESDELLDALRPDFRRVFLFRVMDDLGIHLKNKLMCGCRCELVGVAVAYGVNVHVGRVRAYVVQR
jgi:hypothetical protein